MLGFFDKGAQRLIGAGTWSSMTAKAALLTLGATTDTHLMTVSAATNATPIVVTVNSTTGMTTGDIVSIGGIAGNLAANGTWRVTVVNGTTFSLQTLKDGLASQGSAAYTSGGYVINLTAATTLDQLSAARAGTSADATLSGKAETNGDLIASPISWAAWTGTAHASIIYEDSGSEATSNLLVLNDGRVQVVMAGAASTSATTLIIEKLSAPLANGTALVFSNGVTATLTAAAAVGARTLTVSAIAAGIAVGHQAEPFKENPGYPVVSSGSMLTDTYNNNTILKRRPF
jgi:hypothetical protein